MKNQKGMKRTIALLLVIAMAWSTVLSDAGLLVVKAEEAVEPKLLVDLDFDNVAPNQEIVVGNVRATGSYNITGSFSESSKNALLLDADGQFLTLTDENGKSILNGLKAVSIDLDLKANRTDTDWVFFAAPSAQEQRWPNEHYLGLLQKLGTVEAERYDNAGSRPGCAKAKYADNKWNHITVTYSEDNTVIYLNGEEVNRYSIKFDMNNILGEDGICYIGRANWGANGEYSRLTVDNFKIYSGELSANDALNLYSEYEDRKNNLEVHPEAGAEKMTLLAELNFDGANAGEAITTEKVLMEGSYELGQKDDGQSLVLRNKNYVTLKKADGSALLAGCNEVCFSADVNFNGELGWLFYAAPSENGQKYLAEQYLGILSKGNILAERYYNKGTRPNNAECKAPTDGWHRLSVRYSSNNTYMYIDEKLVASNNDAKDVKSIVGTNGILQIGKANWGNGEYCNVELDNIKIYGVVTNAEVDESGYSLNLGYVTEDIALPTTVDNNEAVWTSSNPEVITNDGKVTRGEENQAVELTVKTAVSEKIFKLVVLKKGADVVSYVSKSPAVGQNGGMKLATNVNGAYEVLHKNQPILYTAKGGKSYTSPVVLRNKDNSGFYMVAAVDGQLITYETKDLITYTNETLVDMEALTGVSRVAAVYDLTDERYEIYVKSEEGTFVVYSSDMKKFEKALKTSYEFSSVTNGPEDAVLASKIGLTTDEISKLVAKFTNPSNTSVSELPSTEIVVKTGTGTSEIMAALNEYAKDKTVTATYSDGTTKTYGIRFSEDEIANINTRFAGEYTIDYVIGGSANYTDAYDELIEERADPYVVYNEDDGYYYFTASYPMYNSGDADGYDRIILRRAKTISGLTSAEEVTIWDEKESSELGRFIWAPEMHKIGDSWYLVATAGLNSGNGTTFNIRPFMIKFNGDAKTDSLLDVTKWGEPTLVKAFENDNIVAGMSLDMTYFEAGGNHYLVWADETKNEQNSSGLSYLFIATIDPENPTQLTSKAQLITKPEYNWELVTYKVNEGPGVFHKDGKVYMTFSASGTGSEYCVGLMYADENADLLNPANWIKLPYPILTSSDFDNEVSGPGHNSFTYDEFGNLVIVYHARVTEEHKNHTGDSLYDPCRHAYVKTVFFDNDGLPVFNMTDEDYIKGGDKASVKLVIEGETASVNQILSYDFEKEVKDGVVEDTTGDNDAKLYGGASIVKDENMGSVLYLDGSPSYGGTEGYLEFPKGFFDGKNEITVSFDVNQISRGGNYFTFTLGKNTDKYLFYKAMSTSEKLALTKHGYNTEKLVTASGAYPNTAREWINITIVVRGNTMELYRDGKLVGSNKNTGVKISELGNDLVGYLGKSLYSGDEYFRGMFDNVKVYDGALTAREVSANYEASQTAIVNAMSDIKYVADNYVIPDQDNITGNISLPSEINGVKVVWFSSNEDVISTVEKENDNYDNTPAGVVTRQAKDKKVTLTAKFTKCGKVVTKKYDCVVKAAPKAISEEDYAGYVFVHFTNTEGTADCEQVYFSLSKDGLNWTDLNKNKPVLRSTMGESGVRDMYIARSAEGDKFYMIATDLSIYHYRSWGEAGSNGSHSIVVWESEDLVNWSEPWLSEIAPKGAGCTWAPEFIYDEKTGEYIVYWASTTLEVDENEKITQEYENHTIYYVKTRDFVHYTEPEVYHAGGRNENGVIIKVIDSTMIENNGTYYRYTKNESIGSIEIEKADSVLGHFTSIYSSFLKDSVPKKVGAVEGPIIFKLNEKTEDGKTQWCMYVDRYGTGSGYYPIVTTDLESGDFSFLNDNEFSLPSKFRHGYVMPVTAEEYQRLASYDWSLNDPDRMTDAEIVETMKGIEGSLVAEYKFEEGLKNTAGSSQAVAIEKGLANYTKELVFSDGISGKALDTKSYGLDLNLENLGEEFTITFYAKPNTNQIENQIVMFMGTNSPERWSGISGQDGKGTYKIWYYSGSGNLVEGVEAKSHTTYASPTIRKGEWSQIAVVGSGTNLKVYIDGEKVCDSNSFNKALLGEAQDILFGANYWDRCFDGSFDEIKVYNKALTKNEIKCVDTVTLHGMPEVVPATPVTPSNTVINVGTVISATVNAAGNVVNRVTTAINNIVNRRNTRRTATTEAEETVDDTVDESVDATETIEESTVPTTAEEAEEPVTIAEAETPVAIESGANWLVTMFVAIAVIAILGGATLVVSKKKKN